MSIDPAASSRAWRAVRRLVESSQARDAATLTVAQGASLVLGVLQLSLVARGLGLSGLGTMSLALSFPALVHGLLDAQSQEAVMRFLVRSIEAGRPAHAASVIRLALAADGAAILAAGIVLWTLLGLAIGPNLGDEAGHLLLLGWATTAISSPRTTARASLVAIRRFRLAAVSDLAAASLSLFAVLVAVRGGATPVEVLTATVVGSGLGLVLTVVVAGRCLRAADVRPWRRSRIGLGSLRREMLRFMVVTDGTASLSTAVREGDVLLLGWIAGPVAAGTYRLAKSLMLPFSAVASSLQSALFPRLAKSRSSYVELISPRSPNIVGGLALGLVGGLLSLASAPWIVQVVGGAEFESAVGPARWAMVGGATVLGLYWVRPALLAGGHVRYLFWNSVVTAAISVAAFAVGASVAGAMGVAAARTLITCAAGSGVAAAWVLRTAPNFGDDQAGHSMDLTRADQAAADPRDELRQVEALCDERPRVDRIDEVGLHDGQTG